MLICYGCGRVPDQESVLAAALRVACRYPCGATEVLLVDGSFGRITYRGPEAVVRFSAPNLLSVAGNGRGFLLRAGARRSFSMADAEDLLDALSVLES